MPTMNSIAIVDQLTKRCVASALAFACSSVSYAQSNAVLNLRAVVSNPSPELVQYIARHANFVDLQTQSTVQPKPRTAREIVYMICGRIPSPYFTTYWAEFQRANSNKSTKPASPEAIVSDVTEFDWPACLKVDRVDQKIRVQKNDLGVADLYQRLTGSKGSDASYAQFFREKLGVVQPGQMLTGLYRTLPVVITPKNDPEEFTRDIKRIANGLPEAVVNKIELDTGAIIVSVQPPEPGGTNPNTDNECEPFPDSHTQIEVNAVVNAYERARSLSKSSTQANVVVVDNGFFGAYAKCLQNTPGNKSDIFTNNSSCMADSSAKIPDNPFPSAFFTRLNKDPTRLATPVGIVTTDRRPDGQMQDVGAIDPVNYVHFVPPSVDASHGTHVTGLILGGPTFQGKWKNLPTTYAWANEPWQQITFLNVAKGGKNLLLNSQNQISFFLTYTGQGTDYIVNLSIAYNGEKNSDTRALFADIRKKMTPKSLLVAAAGNEPLDVASANLVPAVLGGPSADNLISVAAYDGSGNLAPFSNYSKDHVDIAAPGCRINSWMSRLGDTANLSGTSMAAPQVTFAATLLRSVAPKASGADIKNRLIASGDLLANNTVRPIAHNGAKLNTAKALYLFDDYLKLWPSPIGGGQMSDEQYLGTLQRPFSVAFRCQGEPNPRKQDEVWGMMRTERGTPMLSFGRNIQQVSECEIRDPNSGSLLFTKTHRILPNGTLEEIPAAQVRIESIPMSMVKAVLIKGFGGAADQ